MSIEYKEFKADWEVKAFNEETNEGEIEGYASFFGNVDSYGDRIVKGAFKKTLKENKGFKVFFNHDMWGLPIGKTIEASEDDNGLRFRAKISNTTQGRDIYTLLKDGVLNSMSIGFQTMKEGMTSDGIRELKEIKLMEISVVGFPANDKALITSVKSEEKIMGRIESLESQLNELKSLLKLEEPATTTPEDATAEQELNQAEVDKIMNSIAEMRLRLEGLAKE